MPTITFTEENIESHKQTENELDFSKHGDLFRRAYDEWMGGRMTDRAAIECIELQGYSTKSARYWFDRFRRARCPNPGELTTTAPTLPTT